MRSAECPDYYFCAHSRHLLKAYDAAVVFCVHVYLDGLIGMAIVGGAAALAVGGIVGLGMALSKK
jgi:hypothetical protein